MFLIRGVLLAGAFCSQHELDKMTLNDMRHTLIVELGGRTRLDKLQAFDDATLAGMGALLAFLRTARIRDDASLKSMTADDMRNALIVELAAQTQMSAATLQEMGNVELVLLGLGKSHPGALTPGDYIRGVLLAGGFRTPRDLNNMSADDQRNTLIVEMGRHSSQSDFQALDDFALGGVGAVMVLLRAARIRSDDELKTMTVDDQRNLVIAEIGAQTGLGDKLQGLTNINLVLAALGVDP